MATQRKRYVIPPAVEAQRMNRYAVLLMIGAFALVGANIAELTPSRLMWFGALLLAVVAIVLAATAVVLRALQWHYDRLADEFHGVARVTSTDVSSQAAAAVAEASEPTGAGPA
jgi:Na+/H+-dicarboxylate symporter